MIESKLHIDGNIHTIKKFSWGVIKHSGQNGFPSSKPLLRKIEMTIEAVSGDFFEDWAFADNSTRNMVLKLQHNILGAGKSREILCYDCHLLEMNTHFSSFSNEPMTFSLVISCGGLELSNSTAVYSELWRKTYPNESTPLILRDEEKEVTKYYLTDLNDNKIDGYKNGDTIILNIETKNRIGDIMSINLDDAEYDFEYNGTIIPNDTLSNIQINNDLEQIQLKVVEQKN